MSPPAGRRGAPWIGSFPKLPPIVRGLACTLVLACASCTSSSPLDSRPLLTSADSAIALGDGPTAVGNVATSLGDTAMATGAAASGDRASTLSDVTVTGANLQAIAKARIDTMDGAIALDMLADLSQTRVFPERTFHCSAASAAEAQRAQESLEAGIWSEARVSFAAALQSCPGNARWWIQAGDVELRDGRADAASDLLRRGLAIDPWDREGHRFLSYAETALGRREESWQQSVLAVLSDPTCEAGWESLKQATLQRGGQFHRQYEFKPAARAVYRHLDLDLDPMENVSHSRGWVAYAISLGTRELRCANFAHQPGPGDPPFTMEKTDIDDAWASWSPLERERYLVLTTLQEYEPEADVRRPGRTPRTWPAIKAAAAQGFLDEAIFLQLLDRALVPEFLEFRDKHPERLIEHVTRFLAVLPNGVGHRRSSQTASAGPSAEQLLASR